MSHRLLPLVLLAAAAVAAPAAAQRRPSFDAASARLDAAPRAEAAPMAAALDAAPRVEAAPAAAARTGRGASAARSALTVLGGAVIGAGVGLLTSQVAWSDWDKSSNSEFKSRRLSFALGGGALGALTALVVGRGSGAPMVPSGAVASPVNGSRDVITEEEVRASTADNLYQLVQALRPIWLRREGASGHSGHAGANTIESPDQAASAVAETGVKVYVERGLVGDIFSLRQITLADVTSLEFLDAATATYRLGQGNPAGAIVVHTGRPRG
jgi:hypothetical protein